MLLWLVIAYLAVSIAIGLYGASKVHNAKDYVTAMHLMLQQHYRHLLMQMQFFQLMQPLLVQLYVSQLLHLIQM